MHFKDVYGNVVAVSGANTFHGATLSTHAQPPRSGAIVNLNSYQTRALIEFLRPFAAHEERRKGDRRRA